MSPLSSTALIAALAFSLATFGGAGCSRDTSTPSAVSARTEGAGASCVACGGHGGGNGVLLAQVGPPVPGPTPTPGPSPTPGPVPTPTPPPTPSPPPTPTPAPTPPPVPGPPPGGGSGGARSAAAEVEFALPTVVELVAYR